ncbi:hypothetical protein ACWEPB_30615 [Kitasatospora cineracea]
MARSKKEARTDGGIGLSILDAVVLFGILASAVALALAGIGAAMLIAIGTFTVSVFRVWLSRRRPVRPKGQESEVALKWKIDSTAGASAEGRWASSNNAAADTSDPSIE